MLPKNIFSRNFLILAGGTAAGQAVLLLASPVLTRLYTPEDFGVLAVFTAILGVIGAVSSLEYKHAIPLPEDDLDAVHLAALSLCIVMTFVVLSVFLLFFFGATMMEFFGVPQIIPYLYLLPFGVFLIGCYEVFYYFSVRKKYFPLISKVNLARAVVIVTLQIAGSAFGAINLLIAQIIGQVTGSFSLGRTSVKGSRELFRQVKPDHMSAMAVRYRRFPIFDSIYGLLAIVSVQIPIFIFAAVFGPVAAGLYALSQRVLSIPVFVMGSAAGNTFFSDAPAARREGRLPDLVTEVHDKLSQLSAPIALLLVLTAPPLFEIVFGEEWRQAGEFARWMAVPLYFQLVSAPLSSLFYVLEQQAVGMTFQIAQVMLRAAALLWGATSGDLILSIILFAVASTAYYVLMFAWFVIETQTAWLQIGWSMLKAFSWGLIVLCPVIVAIFASASIPVLAVAFCTSLVFVAVRYFFVIFKN